MPRKSRAADDNSKARLKLPAKQEVVPISRLRLRIGKEEGPRLSFDESSYTLQVRKGISSEVLALLLELRPLVVVRQERHFEVLAGARLFMLAAFCLDPSAEIPVLVVDKRYVNEHENLLRYLDLAVMPLLHTLRGSAYELYQIFNEAGQRKEVWLPPLDASATSFAQALGVKPASLSRPAAGSQKAGLRERSSQQTSDQS